MYKFSFIISFLAGLSTLIGFLFVLFLKDKTDKVIINSLSFASGIMISLSIFDLIPEGINYIKTNFFMIPSIIICFIFLLIGIIVFSFMSFLCNKKVNNKFLSIGILSMISIILHNIPEGIATFITTKYNVKIGILFSLAIAFHNIPEGISIALPIYYGSNNKFKAFLYTFVAAISEPFGALIAFLFLKSISYASMGVIYSLTAGIMISISINILKEFKNKRRKNFILFFLLGMFIFFITRIIF